tara:strand:+ start:429 stop:872 length:444 start_codon:yes stop_codon:yes gene_type:complete
MKVILTTNIKKLGKIGDQVTVKDGFARNFLFPNKMALRDTKNNLQYYEKIKEEIISKENEKKDKALNLVEDIKKTEIKFTKEADEKDQLYGAVSKKEIINFLSEKNITLLSDDIKISNSIRTLGKHSIIINPYIGIEIEINITVVRT